jgi:hypothetical protein
MFDLISYMPSCSIWSHERFPVLQIFGHTWFHVMHNLTLHMIWCHTRFQVMLDLKSRMISCHARFGVTHDFKSCSISRRTSTSRLYDFMSQSKWVTCNTMHAQFEVEMQTIAVWFHVIHQTVLTISGSIIGGGVVSCARFMVEHLQEFALHPIFSRASSDVSHSNIPNLKFSMKEVGLVSRASWGTAISQRCATRHGIRICEVHPWRPSHSYMSESSDRWLYTVIFEFNITVIQMGISPAHGHRVSRQ